MTPREYLLNYVEKAHGNSRVVAARALGVPYPTFAAICNGTRGVSARMARKLAIASSGDLDAGRLVFIRADEGKAA